MKKPVVIWMHVGFCCMYLLIFLSNILLSRHSSPEEMGQGAVLHNLAKPVIFYVSYFLMYLVLKNKKNIIYFILLYLIAFFYPEFGKHLLVSLSLFHSSGDAPHTISLNFNSLIATIQTSFWGALFYLGVDWFQKKQQKKELEKQNLQSELKLLKNQVNPHFLFNTLNNIDSLISSNPGKASAMLVGLSGMMRYMIYDTNAGKVPLEQELQQIRNYLDLQEMQYANAGLVEYTVIGNPEGIDVAPMLFIPFIENAFKHCTDKDKRHAIRFLFDIDGKTIRFESVNIADPSQHITKDSTGGIGLETVKRRLELLYPGRHKLQIDRKNDFFSVFLSIDTQ